MHLCLFI